MPLISRLFRIKILLNSLLAVGVFFILGAASTFAAVNTYTVTGGDPTALPNVGAASVALSNITITEDGTADDFNTGAFEDIRLTINTTNYPSVVFDSTIAAGAITITGTCTASTITTTSAVYSAGDTVLTIRATDNSGNPLCAAGQNMVIAGLKVKTTYAAAAPGNNALFGVDNTTTAIGSPVNAPNVNYAITVGTLASTSVVPASTSVGVTGQVTVSFTTSTALPAQSRIIITFPSGYDLSSFGTSQTPTNATGITAANWSATRSGQVITMIENNTGPTNPGAISFKLTNILNPSSTGSTGTYTINTTITGGTNEIQKDTAVAASTIVGNSTTYTVTTPEDFTLTNSADGVVLTWTDPDDDTTQIQILKGTDPDPVNGEVYTTVEVGLGTYTDTDVEDGEVVTYQLRAYGSGRTSDLTDETSITVDMSETSDDDEGSDDSSGDEDTSTEEESDDSSDDTSTEESDEDSSSDEDMEEEEESFSDLSGHWAEAAVEAMTEAGVVEGNPDGSFDPDGNLNRAEAAALFWRIVGADMGCYNEESFSDVSTDEWYADDVHCLKSLGLVEGNPDGTYEPSEEINRAEFLKMAMNVYLYLYPDTDDSVTEVTDYYADLDTNSWYANIVTLATDWGFVHGSACDEGTCFYAGSSITRAEATTILYNMFADMYGI
jgi:hypothetical protein